MDSPLADTTMATAMVHLPKPQTTTTSIPIFRLFDLPIEIILQILSHACTTPHPIPITHITTPSPALQPQITRTCHLLRHEGLKLFYQQNTFLSANTLYGLSDFWSFLICIGPAHARSIRSILIEWVSGPWEPRSLDDRTWAHFVCEMQFLTQARVPMGLQGRAVFVRTRGGKVLMGTGQLAECYQITLRERVGGEEWLDANALAKGEVAWRLADGSKFWV